MLYYPKNSLVCGDNYSQAVDTWNIFPLNFQQVLLNFLAKVHINFETYDYLITKSVFPPNNNFS